MSQDPKPVKSLRQRYRNILEVSLIVTLLTLIFTFFAFKKYESEVTMLPTPDLSLEVIKIPVTKWPEKKPRPQPPSFPVGAEDDDILDEIPLAMFDVRDNFQITDIAPPPQEEDEIEYEFIAVSEKPELIKRVAPVYPEMARKAGIHGIVVTKVLINKKGDVEKVELFKSIPMLDDAAITAAKKFKFKPGKQRDKCVKVWMNIPFHFKLK